MKVSEVNGQDITVIVSNMAYDGKSGPRKDVTKYADNSPDYYAKTPVHFISNDLLQMKQSGAIYSVHRK